MMELFICMLAIIPFMGFGISLIFKNTDEKGLAFTAGMTTLFIIGLNITLLANTLLSGYSPIHVDLLTIYKSSHFEFTLDLYYDWLSAVYSFIGGYLFWIISRFSRTYMHRERGYKRFYNHFLLFFSGINLLIVSGNFETLFLGWEIVGISSFLLITFFRERYLPIKNGLKVLSFYRIGDVSLLTAIWLCHHVLQNKMSFYAFHEAGFYLKSIMPNETQLVYAGLLLALAAAVKSAQFPFFTWLPRAMEGPTVSSAIFYGSMSIHVGVFLLIRTAPIWEHSHLVRIMLFAIGGITTIMTSLISKVQSSGKSQIAYASASQLGLMFIEISLGLYGLAAFHFACNALFRTYQFLSSPSIMSYLIHQQFYEYIPDKKKELSFLPMNIRNTIYLLALKEFSLDRLWYAYQWKPFKRIGKAFHVLRNRIAESIVVMLMLFGLYGYVFHPLSDIQSIPYVSWFYSLLALILILIAWTERINVLRAWTYIMAGQVFFMLGIAQEHSFELNQIYLYISGILCSYVLGYWSLHNVKSKENTISLHEFHGHIYEHPRYGLVFLLSSLMMVGFPISPTFIGLDMLFSDIEFNHTLLLFLSALTFLMLELAVFRIYARIFLGQHVKTYHEIAFRSS